MGRLLVLREVTETTGKNQRLGPAGTVLVLSLPANHADSTVDKTPLALSWCGWLTAEFIS
jgi:hypothetical protein